MKLNDLKEFDIVKRRDGLIMIVLYNSLHNCLALFSPETCGCSDLLEAYGEDMTIKLHTNSDRDIVAVYKSTDLGKYTLLKNYFENRCEDYEWTWEREEVKEMTIAEIEALVGCKIKIIKEDK